MTVHVCHNDGAPVGEFLEADFRDRIFAGEITSDQFYWHDGMADWRPVADYRALAKTVRIQMDQFPDDVPVETARVAETPPPPAGLFGRLKSMLKRS